MHMSQEVLITMQEKMFHYKLWVTQSELSAALICMYARCLRAAITLCGNDSWKV